MSAILQPNQELFAKTLSGLTGLNLDVIRGWTLAEESSNAAARRQAQGNNNWLNIGYFDSGAASWAKGGGPFSNPRSAAQATAQFLKGQRWGASPGIRQILSTAGASPQDQINAIAKSGWASSGYGGGSHLAKTYALASGLPSPALPGKGAVTPSPTQASTQVHAKSGPQAALDILNAKSPGEALQLFKNSQLTVDASPSVAASGVSPNAAGVVKLAMEYLGTPYKWGGTTPQGFDCSGLLQYVWAKKGVEIPRVTYDQVKAGYQVPINQLQPGDAVFFGDTNHPHHVGMYVGHGQFIEAPHTGAVVRISNLADRKDFAQARRFA